MATVIDEFIIKVKLDTSEYERGQKKIAKSTKETKENIQRAGEATGAALQSIGKETTNLGNVMSSVMGKGGAIGIAIGSLIYAGIKLDDKLFDIAGSIRQVGIDSKNFNTSAANLRNLQNASEMVGGSMEDATQSVGNLAQSLYNLKFNGQVSESIRMVGRLGVNFTDSYGKARDFNDVLIDIADSLDRNKAAGKMTDSEAFFAAGQAGLTGGLQILASSGGANVRAEIARQGGRKQITEATLKGATDWRRASTSLGQGVVAEAGIAGVERFGAARANINQTLEGTAKNATIALGDFADSLSAAAKSIYEFTGGSMEDRARALISKGKASGSISTVSSDLSTLEGVTKYRADIIGASQKYGIPAEVLTGLLRTESNFNPNAVNSSGARGIAQIMPDTAKDMGITPGLNASTDIYAAAKYIADNKNRYMAHGGDEDVAIRFGVDAYHTGYNNLIHGKNIGPESIAYANKVFAGTKYQNTPHPWMPDTGSGGGSTVNINGDIVVNTQATDAHGVANGIAGALTRNKQLATNVEGGQH